MKGRPRTFSLEHGLDVAAEGFKQFGYESTSINYLCKQLNVPPTSLYAAYKDKPNLFKQVLARDVESLSKRLKHQLKDCQTTGEVYRRNLELGVSLIYESGTVPGIMVLDCGLFVKIQSVSTFIEQLTGQIFAIICDAFRATSSESPEELANVVLTLLRGMSSAARSGKTEEESLTTVEFLCVGFDC